VAGGRASAGASPAAPHRVTWPWPRTASVTDGWYHNRYGPERLGACMVWCERTCCVCGSWQRFIENKALQIFLQNVNSNSFFCIF